MNNLNPLHIGTLLVVIIAFLFVKIDSAKVELREAQESFKESEKLAVDVSSLKSVFANKKKIEKSLERILANRVLQGANLNVKKTKKSLKIHSDAIEAGALNLLMGKILNGTYNITELKIKRLSETKAMLDMEIQW